MNTLINRQKSKLFLTLFIFTLLIPTLFAQSKLTEPTNTKTNSIPVIVTERGNYQINETVQIYGMNFQSYERIRLNIKYLNNSLQQEILLDSLDIYADGKGYMSADWKIYDVNQTNTTFSFEANGTNSRNIAKTEFTTNLVPTPIVLSGNPECSTLNGSSNPAFAHITSDFGFKLDTGTPNGTFPFTNGGFRVLTGGASPEPSNSVTVATISSELTSWSSTRPITAVILKRGNAATVYPYNPASQGPDGPLPTNVQQGISHIEFCFQPIAKIIIIKEANPPSTQQFDFTASAGMTPANFSLVDNSFITNPMQMFTVTDFNIKTITESNSGPYTLRDITCSVDVGTGGTPTPVRNGNAIDIDIKAGDQVTCTFNNDFVTAAAVSISGKVFDSNGNGLSRASVSITDSNGNLRTIISNQFGYFKFNEVEVGDNYFLNVRHKSYVFVPQLINVGDEITNLQFVPSQ